MRIQKETAYLAVLFLFLLSEVFGGALRYYLNELGAPWLVYLPKALILVALLCVLFESAYKGKIRRPLLVVALVTVMYATVGAYFTGGPAQPLFTIFSTLPLIFGVVVAPYLSASRITKCAWTLWACVAAGIVLDYYTAVPWAGTDYSLAGIDLLVSRDWTTFGVERIAGFSRASFDAADQLLFLSLPPIFLARSKFLGFAAWLASGMLIVFTTSKTMLGIYAVFTLLLMAMLFFPKRLKRFLAQVLPFAIAVIGIALPFSTLFVDYRLDLSSPVSELLFASFGGRLMQMWPDGLQLAFAHGSSLLGRGIGGIGVAQSYFEPALLNSADNMYLYLYVSLGVFALPLIFVYANRIRKIDLTASPWSRLLWFSGIAVLLAGWTSNGLESAFIATVLGVTLAHGITSSARRDRRLRLYDSRSRRDLRLQTQ